MDLLLQGKQAITLQFKIYQIILLIYFKENQPMLLLSHCTRRNSFSFSSYSSQVLQPEVISANTVGLPSSTKLDTPQKKIHSLNPLKIHQINFNIIKAYLILLLVTKLFFVANSAEYFRLSTQQNQPRILYNGSSIISTLGTYKATLNSVNCTLQIYKFMFSEKVYTKIGNFNSKVNSNCISLEVVNSKLVTNQNLAYFQTNNMQYNHSTIFTIDDFGVLRLIGTNYRVPSFETRSEGNLQSFQTNYTQFANKGLNNDSFSYSTTKLYVQFGDTTSIKRNLNGWSFQSGMGTLVIWPGNSTIPNNFQTYFFNEFKIVSSRIIDFKSYGMPEAQFNNISYHPPCSRPKNIQQWRTPFTFQIDPYWPIISLYEQGKYKILQVTYARLFNQEYLSQINDTNRTYHYRYYSPCPREMFEYMGSCVSICPSGFWNEIRGQVGKCVLTCEENSFKDENNKICYCMTNYQLPFVSKSKIINKCQSSLSINTPFGCQCKNNLYYDSILTFGCVLPQKCPPSTVPYSGVCAHCPPRCLSCSQNPNKLRINFLQCTQCQKGYKLASQFCVKQCISYQNKMVVYDNTQTQQTCVKCIQQGCIKCNNDGTGCKKCSILYALSQFQGKCYCNSYDNLDDCLFAPPVNGTVLVDVYAGNFSTLCVPLSPDCIKYSKGFYKGQVYLKCDSCPTGTYAFQDKCVQSCPKGTIFHRSRYCICQGNNLGQFNLTLFGLCVSLKACPLQTSFDSFSFSCIPCPHGCLTCTYFACTSCFPGYFLLLSPQQSMCRRLSPHTQCSNLYEFQQNNTCVAKINKDEYSMNLCLSNVKNCQICQRNNAQICTKCQSGYLLYNNTCILQCPKGMIKYMQTCLLLQIENCSIPYLANRFQSMLINDSTIEISAPYRYFINFKQNEQYVFAKPQDPIGFASFSAKYKAAFTDPDQHYSYFYEPYWKCKKCISGYGLSKNHTACLPCPANCKNCYLADSSSCLAEDIPTPINCPDGYIDMQTLQCLQSCNSATKYPSIKDGQLYCLSATNSTVADYVRVDSSSYWQGQGKGWLVFFVFDSPVKNISISTAQSKTSQSDTSIPQTGQRKAYAKVYSLVDSSPSHQKVKLYQSAIPSISSTSSEIIANQYIKLAGSQTFYSIQLAPNQLQTDTNLTFPNKLYGSTVQTTRNQFMKTWLAYIGYIMAITILVLHCVYIGIGHIYKMDNLLIFVQSIFYFLYVRLLVGRLVVQFYYGWFYAHAGFLPNLLSQYVPPLYFEQEAPHSYKLVSLDGNFIRNAGFSLVWMLIFYALLLIVTIFVKCVLSKLLHKYDVWYPLTFKNIAQAIFQFFSMNLMFFAVAHLRYAHSSTVSDYNNFYMANRILSIITICMISLYTLIKLFIFDPIGGIYMLKRNLIACILVTSYQNPIYLLPLILLQLFFMVLRFILQTPTSKFYKFTVLFQSFIFIGCYILMFLCIDTGVNTVIVSVIIFILIVYLAYDLTNIYLEFRNEYELQEMAKIYQSDFKQEAIRKTSMAKIEPI